MAGILNEFEIGNLALWERRIEGDLFVEISRKYRDQYMDTKNTEKLRYDAIAVDSRVEYYNISQDELSLVVYEEMEPEMEDFQEPPKKKRHATLTEEEIEAKLGNATSKSTKQNTAWGVKVFTGNFCQFFTNEIIGKIDHIRINLCSGFIGNIFF